MSILKITPIELNNKSAVGTKWSALTNAFLMSMLMLSALDLLLTSFRGDSLSKFTSFVITDLTLTLIVIFMSSDHIVDKKRGAITCFLGYMFFLWVCITVLKLVFQI